VLGLAACRERQEAPGAAPAADAADPGVGTTAAPPRPSQLEVTVTAEVIDAGSLAIPFSGDGRPEIPPARALLVETNLPLQNYRVRVFDEVDRGMVSNDDAEDTDGGIRYRIEFPEPLKSGHRYTVSVDAQTGPELLDSHGRAHDDVRLEFRIAGEKVKDQPPPPKRRRRR
jgi:hypothetical protein